MYKNLNGDTHSLAWYKARGVLVSLASKVRDIEPWESPAAAVEQIMRGSGERLFAAVVRYSEDVSPRMERLLLVKKPDGDWDFHVFDQAAGSPGVYKHTYSSKFVRAYIASVFGSLAKGSDEQVAHALALVLAAYGRDSRIVETEGGKAILMTFLPGGIEATVRLSGEQGNPYNPDGYNRTIGFVPFEALPYEGIKEFYHGFLAHLVNDENPAPTLGEEIRNKAFEMVTGLDASTINANLD